MIIISAVAAMALAVLAPAKPIWVVKFRRDAAAAEERVEDIRKDWAGWPADQFTG